MYVLFPGQLVLGILESRINQRIPGERMRLYLEAYEFPTTFHTQFTARWESLVVSHPFKTRFQVMDRSLRVTSNQVRGLNVRAQQSPVQIEGELDEVPLSGFSSVASGTASGNFAYRETGSGTVQLDVNNLTLRPHPKLPPVLTRIQDGNVTMTGRFQSNTLRVSSFRLTTPRWAIEGSFSMPVSSTPMETPVTYQVEITRPITKTLEGSTVPSDVLSL